MVVTEIVKLIDFYSYEFWPDSTDPPRKSSVIERLLRKHIRKLTTDK